MSLTLRDTQSESISTVTAAKDQSIFTILATNQILTVCETWEHLLHTHF